MVARVNGKIRARKRWGRFNKKDRITKQFANEIFKNNRTFDPDVIKDYLYNKEKQRYTIEQRSYGKKYKINKKYKYQAVVEASLKDGTFIVARSQLHTSDFPTSKAMEEAEESFWERVAQSQGAAYDEDIGRTFEHKVGVIKRGIVQYLPTN